jgi:hypothetical protein
VGATCRCDASPKATLEETAGQKLALTSPSTCTRHLRQLAQGTLVCAEVADHFHLAYSILSLSYSACLLYDTPYHWWWYSTCVRALLSRQSTLHGASRTARQHYMPRTTAPLRRLSLSLSRMRPKFAVISGQVRTVDYRATERRGGRTVGRRVKRWEWPSGGQCSLLTAR